MSTTDTPSPSAMSAAREKIAELERALDFNLQGNRESVARIEQLEREPAAALATIAELQTLADNQAEDIERLQAKIANQAERIRHLEGATNHATGTPLSQAHAKIANLESQLEAHAWTISPAMAQAQIDALNAQIYRLRAALIKIAYMTRHEWSANVAVEALEGQP
jgi:chromosome segregation ATPase